MPILRRNEAVGTDKLRCFRASFGSFKTQQSRLKGLKGTSDEKRMHPSALCFGDTGFGSRSAQEWPVTPLLALFKDVLFFAKNLPV